jgi:hypothetical protein
VKTKPPRAVYIPFPFGLNLGHPGNAAEQRAVLDLAFSMLDAPSGPVLLDYRANTPEDEDGAPLQASDVSLDAEAQNLDFATDVQLMRNYWKLHKTATGRTGVGLSRIPPEGFRGVVRFIEAYLADPTADYDRRPPDMPVPNFLRYFIDDLRVMYVEARLQTHPNESSPDRQRWLLGLTALGRMIRQLRDAMNASDDSKTKAAAFGIGR